MTTTRTAAIVLRLAGATLSLFAMGYQLFAVHIPAGYSVLNFFSYFTNLSNLMISIVFVVSAVRLMNGRLDPSATDVALRGGVVVYILFVGLVFNTLLTDVDLGSLQPWVNGIVHFVVPVLGIVDWILWPPRRRLPLSVVGWWMIWPLPRHLGQTVWLCIMPKGVRCACVTVPVPWHCVQTSGVVPGAQPLPLQVGHCSERSIVMDFSQPKAASVKSTDRLARMLSPRCGALGLRRPPPPKPPPKKLPKMSPRSPKSKPPAPP